MAQKDLWPGCGMCPGVDCGGIEEKKFMFADIYGNPPNPVLDHNPGYGLFLVLLIVVAGFVFWVMTKKNECELQIKALI
jgi:hypothetical protein